MFKYIASGLFGTEALSGGTLMIIWGIVFHFMIAFIFTLVLFPVYPLVTKWLKNKYIKNKYITGIFYGLLIWTIMNCIVIPFSHTVKKAVRWTQAAIAALILVATTGIPVALIAHRYYARNKTV